MLRKIPLKTFPAVHEGGEELKSIGLLEMVVKSPRQGGETLDTMRSGIKVLEAIDAAKVSGAAELLLDEASWQFAKSRVQTMQWAFINKSFIEFSDDVIEAPQFDPNAPTAESPSV